MTKFNRRILLVLLLTVAPLPDSFAQTSETETTTAETPIARWAEKLDRAAEALGQADVPDSVLSQIRDSLEEIRDQSRAWIAEHAPALQRAQLELDALGPAPAEGEADEAAGVATQRQELTRQLAAVAGPVKETELLLGRASRMIGEIGEIRRQRFA